MTTTKDLESTLLDQDLPIELLRVPNSHCLDLPATVSMLSGTVPVRPADEAICPLLMRRNLLVPAHQAQIVRDGWRVQ